MPVINLPFHLVGVKDLFKCQRTSINERKALPLHNHEVRCGYISSLQSGCFRQSLWRPMAWNRHTLAEITRCLPGYTPRQGVLLSSFYVVKNLPKTNGHLYTEKECLFMHRDVALSISHSLSHLVCLVYFLFPGRLIFVCFGSLVISALIQEKFCCAESVLKWFCIWTGRKTSNTGHFTALIECIFDTYQFFFLRN